MNSPRFPRPRSIAPMASVLLLAACAGIPSGPQVAVMPAPGKPLDLFAQEDRQCRNYADQALGIPARGSAPANASTPNNTPAGSDSPKSPASTSNTATYSGSDAQRRYDIAYQQCMYAKGNQLPGYGYRRPAAAPSGGTPYYYPPPPPATPTR